MAKKARHQKLGKKPQKKATKVVPAAKKKTENRIEAIAKAKAKVQPLGAAKAGAKGNAFAAKRPGRRGRRPKNLAEYTPQHNEEDSYVLESEVQSLEYDTGIRVAGKGDDNALNVERFEDFDEELNFDW